MGEPGDGGASGRAREVAPQTFPDLRNGLDARQVSEYAVCMQAGIRESQQPLLSKHAQAKPELRPSEQACCGKGVQGQRVYLNAWRRHELIGERALQHASSTPQLLPVGREGSVERLQHCRQRFCAGAPGAAAAKYTHARSNFSACRGFRAWAPLTRAGLRSLKVGAPKSHDAARHCSASLAGHVQFLNKSSTSTHSAGALTGVHGLRSNRDSSSASSAASNTLLRGNR